MGVAYEITPIGGLTVPYGGVLVYPLNLASRGRIHKVVVARTDAPGSGTFTVDLYNCLAAGNNTTVDLVDANGNALGRDLFKVMPTINGASGIAAYFSDAATGGFGFPFFSQDGNIPVGTNPNGDRFKCNDRTVYVVITASAGEKFSLNVGTDADMT